MRGTIRRTNNGTKRTNIVTIRETRRTKRGARRRTNRGTIRRTTRGTIWGPPGEPRTRLI